ncbi:MAG: FtsX-like permease family protein [Bacillota bacterium]
MTLLDVAWKNVRHQAHGYAAYFLSSSFAVWLFYLYAALLANPGLPNEPVTRSVMTAVLYLVAIFGLVFVLYSHSAFLKVKQKQLGLMTLLGMEPNQVARLVHYENGILGTGAVTTGLVLGTISSKLFFLGIGRALGLEQPIPFRFSLGATLLTTAVFAVIFAGVSLYGQFQVWRLPVVELIRGAVCPKVPPGFSWWLVAVCLLSLGTSYGLVLTANANTVQRRLLPAMGLLLLGTYLLFAQGSVACLAVIRRNRRLYYQRTNLLTVSQLVYRMHDNARVLFASTILATLVMTVVGLYSGAFNILEQQALRYSPLHVMLVGTPGEVGPERVRQVLSAHGLELAGEAQVLALQAALQHQTAGGFTIHTQGLVLPLSGANRWLETLLREPALALQVGQVAQLVDPALAGAPEATVRVGIGVGTSSGRAESHVTFPVVERRVVRAFNLSESVVVLDDSTFEALFGEYGPSHGTELYAWQLADWRVSQAAVHQLEREIDPDYAPGAGQTGSRQLTATVEFYDQARQGAGYLLFLGCFLGLLFFLAAGNLLYFKLFTDLYEDRRQYATLHKVGVGVDEVRRVVGTQTFLLFFTPLAVATIHAGVALKVLGDLLASASLYGPALVVVASYGVLQMIYLAAVGRAYTRALTAHW